MYCVSRVILILRSRDWNKLTCITLLPLQIDKRFVERFFPCVHIMILTRIILSVGRPTPSQWIGYLQLLGYCLRIIFATRKVFWIRSTRDYQTFNISISRYVIPKYKHNIIMEYAKFHNQQTLQTM